MVTGASVMARSDATSRQAGWSHKPGNRRDVVEPTGILCKTACRVAVIMTVWLFLSYCAPFSSQSFDILKTHAPFEINAPPLLCLANVLLLHSKSVIIYFFKCWQLRKAHTDNLLSLYQILSFVFVTSKISSHSMLAYNQHYAYKLSQK